MVRGSLTGSLFLYELRDAGTHRANREDNWGLLTTNGTPKPAWHAFTAALGPYQSPRATSLKAELACRRGPVMGKT